MGLQGKTLPAQKTRKLARDPNTQLRFVSLPGKLRQGLDKVSIQTYPRYGPEPHVERVSCFHLSEDPDKEKKRFVQGNAKYYVLF